MSTIQVLLSFHRGESLFLSSHNESRVTSFTTKSTQVKLQYTVTVYTGQAILTARPHLINSDHGAFSSPNSSPSTSLDLDPTLQHLKLFQLDLITIKFSVFKLPSFKPRKKVPQIFPRWLDPRLPSPICRACVAASKNRSLPHSSTVRAIESDTTLRCSTSGSLFSSCR